MNYKTWILTGSVASLPLLQIIPDLDFLSRYRDKKSYPDF